MIPSVSNRQSRSRHAIFYFYIIDLGKPCPAVEEKLKTFERIDFNIYKTVRYTNKRAKEKMICDCFLTKEELARGEMGCGEDCLNRLLMIECCSRCNLKDRCSNKRFQNLEYARCEMFKTEMKGFGLRALEDIPADTFLFEYVGEVVDTREFHRRALGNCSRCNLKDRCSNKRFQNLEYARCEMFKTEMKGFGLRALEDIPADTFLFEYVGEVVDTREFHRRALDRSAEF
ncbi:histone-lysine N-methyltransferase SETD2-like [Diaphorina citri]|uniref:Histone-lysine N-methyltransferase SETD2-like n=1 Tax=Diaphorina citri TaxID=121845 RepID=A0A3Q0IXX3_DIACI|nr:histone-lysine N-methyltransferase SETD2-like [Diaphorina citri]